MPYTGRRMTGRKKMQERMSAKRKDAKKTAASKPKVRVLKPGDKVATKKKQTFAQAFAAARKEKGAGKVFTWNGKRYSTNTADDKKKTTAKKTTAKKTTAKKTTAKKTTAKKKMSDREAISKTYGAGKTVAVFGATPAKVSTKAKTKQANRGKKYAGMNSEQKASAKRASEGKKYEKKASSPTKAGKGTVLRAKKRAPKKSVKKLPDFHSASGIKRRKV